MRSGKSVVPMRAEWAAPVTLRQQTERAMPWVIANKVLVASNGNWVLPYWQEYTFHFHQEMMVRNNKFNDGIKRDVPEHCDPVKMFSEGKGAALQAMQSKAEAAEAEAGTQHSSTSHLKLSRLWS